MSLRTAIYLILAEDTVLTDALAVKPSDLGQGPAIYETWAAPGTAMPYMNLTYSFRAQGDAITRRGTLGIDIFIDSYDTTRIEAINNRVKGLLSNRRILDEEDGPVFIYLDTEGDVPEPEDGITHWHVDFSITHWDRSVINMQLNR